MRKFPIVLCLLLSLSACIQGSFKGLYSYYSKTQKANPKLFLKTSNYDTIVNKINNPTEKIILINGSNLKSYLSINKNTIVYIWGPNCHSDICIPLQIIEQKCLEKGYNLFVVAEYYDLEKMQYHYNLANNIFGIDVEYYKTNLTTKYLDLFFNDIDSKMVYSKISDKFLEFKNGEFVRSYENINQLKN